MPSIVYTVKEHQDLFAVVRGGTYLATKLVMTQAVRKAGELARAHHERTGLPVAVELSTAEGHAWIARYAKPSSERDSAVA